ncbi:MAG TPA: hypothetical protein VMS38_33815 [Pseudorhodoferax sp.]|jgi:hypothetical protein|nr:hypothetical protein [Pseudorhodoferax sp.]
MTTIQFRRRLIVILLLCTAAVAALVRHRAEPGSTVHDVSTVLMLLWLPVLGSIIGWVYGKLQRRPPPAPQGFAPDSAFQPQALVAFTLRPALLPVEDVPVRAGEHRCVLVVGHQGFQMRWQLAPHEHLRRGETHQAPVEFLSPAQALPLLPQGTTFRMMVGDAFVGDGRVVQLLAGAASA